MICPKCTSEIMQGDLFCAGCGLDLKMVMNACPNCGVQFEPDDAFCVHCGRKLAKAAAPEIAPTAKEKFAVKTTTAVNKERLAAGKTVTILSHEVIKDIAGSFECNRLSPFSTLPIPKKKDAEIKCPVAADVLEAILKPQKICSLTAVTQQQMIQKILLVKDSACYRWVDKSTEVVITAERSPRDFLDSICGDIAAHVSHGGRSVALLKKEQIRILKGIYSLCQVLILLKVKVAFTTLGQLKSFLKTGDGMKGHVEKLAEKGFIQCTGIDDPIVTLERSGEEIVQMLENYDAFYHFQVMSENRDECPSLYLIKKAGKLFMLSNPRDGDDVVIRNMDAADLRSVLGWAWVTDLIEEKETAEAPAAEYATTGSNCG